MRIGCLQFAPRLAQVDENIGLADEILDRANPEDLDLLVLPELAFTGYNFKSLNHISPFLEFSDTGITSAWAKSVALKHDCVVIAGYPEMVDPKSNWPANPEYYNSAMVVDGEGDTMANYRKSHLYYTDETWALEGSEGFYFGHLPGLGKTSMGICMDLNPYRFEAPWDAYEFAYHVLDNGCKLVILSMAWNTMIDAAQDRKDPEEPDMETLAYWLSRLQPIINVESSEETIIVFANRTGTESEVDYLGTSAVVGIKAGEVRLYGMLGRGEQGLLVVDTDSEPYGRLQFQGAYSGQDEEIDELNGPESPARLQRHAPNQLPGAQDDSPSESRGSSCSGSPTREIQDCKTSLEGSDDSISERSAIIPIMFESNLNSLNQMVDPPINGLSDLSKVYEESRRPGEIPYFAPDMGSVAKWLDGQLDTLVLTPRTIETGKVAHQKAMQEKAIRQAKQAVLAENAHKQRMREVDIESHSAGTSYSSETDDDRDSEQSDGSDIIHSPHTEDPLSVKKSMTSGQSLALQNAQSHATGQRSRGPPLTTSSDVLITRCESRDADSPKSGKTDQKLPKWMIESPTKSQIGLPLSPAVDSQYNKSDMGELDLPILQPASHNRFQGRHENDHTDLIKPLPDIKKAMTPKAEATQLAVRPRRRHKRAAVGIEGYVEQDERMSPRAVEFRQFWAHEAQKKRREATSQHTRSPTSPQAAQFEGAKAQQLASGIVNQGLSQPRSRVAELAVPEQKPAARKRRPKELTLPLSNKTSQQESRVPLASPSMLDFRRGLKTPKAMKLVYERAAYDGEPSPALITVEAPRHQRGFR